MQYTTRCRFLVLALLLWLSLTGAALAAPLPQNVSDRVLALAYAHHLHQQDTDAFMATLHQAWQAGSPVGPMLRKIEEGLAKQVPPTRITAAVRAMSQRMAHFAELLDGQDPAERSVMLERLEELHAMGIDVEDIRTAIRNRKQARIMEVVRALETRTALTQAGLDPDSVRTAVDKGLQAGFFQQSGLPVARLARTALQHGTPRKQVEQTCTRVLASAMSMEQAANNLGIREQERTGTTGRSAATGRHGRGNSGAGAGGGAGGSGGSGGGKGGGRN